MCSFFTHMAGTFSTLPVASQSQLQLMILALGRFQNLKNKLMDIFIAHLTPASQAQGWINIKSILLLILWLETKYISNCNTEGIIDQGIPFLLELSPVFDLAINRNYVFHQNHQSRPVYMQAFPWFQFYHCPVGHVSESNIQKLSIKNNQLDL